MTDAIEVRRLDWDSHHFGLEIGQFSRPPDDEVEIAEALQDARARGFDCLYCLVEAGDFPRAWRMQAAGFVERDMRLEFGRTLGPQPGAVPPHPVGLRPCVGADVEPMAALSAAAFAGTRFAADPGFPRLAVASLYDAWLRNSVAGFADAVLVSGEPGRPDGFVTLHQSGTTARIGLIAVAPHARASGLGRELVGGAIAWAALRDCHELRVVTQGRNAAAQRLYQRCGFVTLSANTWFHAWPERPSALDLPLPENGT